MIVVDIESSGVDPENSCILSIGAVDFNNPERIFYEECKVFEGAIVEEAALAFNGFTKEQIYDVKKKTDTEVIRLFSEWADKAENKTIAGHNPATLDMRFLRATAKRASLISSNTPYGTVFGQRSIDLHTLCYAHLLKRGIPPPQKNKRTAIHSDSIHDYVGLPKEPTPHHGLTGAKMEAEAFSRLLHGKNLLEEFKKYPIPEYLTL